jgi:hypothetical protein
MRRRLTKDVVKEEKRRRMRRMTTRRRRMRRMTTRRRRMRRRMMKNTQQ